MTRSGTVVQLQSLERGAKVPNEMAKQLWPELQLLPTLLYPFFRTYFPGKLVPQSLTLVNTATLASAVGVPYTCDGGCAGL
jgi:hypothetical protein